MSLLQNILCTVKNPFKLLYFIPNIIYIFFKFKINTSYPLVMVKILKTVQKGILLFFRMCYPFIYQYAIIRNVKSNK